MSTQLPLEFEVRPALERDDFLISPCNETAVRWIDAWETWPNGLLVLSGPSGSGKSHLTQVFAALADAQVIPFADLDEDIIARATQAPRCLAVEAADGNGNEEYLFHLINATRQSSGKLLITGRTPPSRWSLALPDLKTRLSAAAQAVIEAPDDALIEGVMVKLFTDRQLRVAPDVVKYAMARMPRSFQAITQLVERSDIQALAQQRAVTVPLMRQILEQSDLTD